MNSGENSCTDDGADGRSGSADDRGIRHLADPDDGECRPESGGNGQPDVKDKVAKFIADKMIINIHERGNCSIVCMQRLPYDLQRGALKPDEIQGFAINSNLEALKHAKLILSDSVGAGMTRSSFLQRKK